MTRQLVFVHGRAQERKDSVALKAEWLDALNEGLGKSGLSLPIEGADVRFPFYGDTLYDMVEGKSSDAAAEVIIRGPGADDDEQEFVREVLEEVRVRNGITDEQLAEVIGSEVVERGPLAWGWLQGILRAVDRYVPYGSGTGIALVTHDVYQYLKNSAIRESIEMGVASAITPGVDTVVVGHSLGSVVAYKLLRGEGHLRGWKVPLFVTVGSPLAVSKIHRTLKSFAPTRCPECVTKWHNAMDDRDVVALYPLTPNYFPVYPEQPAIENRTDVRNRTTNRHGIAGYLDDQHLARLIHDALVA